MKKTTGKVSKKKRGLWWKIPLTILAVFTAVIITYCLYVILSYSRIEDNQPLTIEGTAKNEVISPDKTYTVISYNIGFGAYTPDFTFFMDGGTQSWAASKESVIRCLNADIALLQQRRADIVLLQETDIHSTRSYQVDQAEMIRSALPDMCSVFALNYHSAFLFYPFYQPHGASNAGLLTLSNTAVTSAVRRSLPITDSFSKFLDLDRCYSVSRLATANGKELVVFNVHTSAYGTDGDLQKQQLGKLFEEMRLEYEKGSYVICAGDFNHDFTGHSAEDFNEQVPEQYQWAAPFPDSMIPEHFIKLTDYKGGMTVPSCRNCDIPYGKDSFTLIVDGFIISDNIEAVEMEILDMGFAYSDHNPVELKCRFR